MKINKDDIKRRIIYRSSYRGTKEMDILMSSFVKSIINNLNENELLELERFVNLSDEDLLKLNKNFSNTKSGVGNKIYKNFYNFKPL
jgi:antitoxin CptB|tara:strand:+ start:325 stop:585 length:261 start_codon:yes stop_codon:yes gene_type:complete